MRMFIEPRHELEARMWASGQRVGIRHATAILYSCTDQIWWADLNEAGRVAVLALSNYALAYEADAYERIDAAKNAPTREQLWQESLARSHAARAREHAGLPPEEPED